MSVMKYVFQIPTHESHIVHKSTGEHAISSEILEGHGGHSSEPVKTEEVPLEMESGDPETSSPTTSNEVKETEVSSPSANSPVSTPEYFSSLMRSYESILEDLNPTENRTDIVVRYYNHEPDNDKIKALRALKLYIHDRPTDQDLIDYESNSIYYGDSVSTTDIQLIAYSLLQNGFELKQIVPSKFHDSWKARSVEIGADSLVINRRSLSLDDIRSFSNDLLVNQ